MNQTLKSHSTTWGKDLFAGLVVFLVALPLCLGIAKASGDVPLMSGILSGIVGGLVVGWLSGSHCSISGPAAGLTAVIAAQMTALGSFQILLLAVMIAGVFQLAMGAARLGFLADFFPSSVIKGLLAAIGLILILKQLPHLLGHDRDVATNLAFVQPDQGNTFSELLKAIPGIHWGPMTVGLVCLTILIIWDRIRFLKSLPIPSALVAVVVGGALGQLLSALGGDWVVSGHHLVNVPVTTGLKDVAALFQFPDFSALSSRSTWMAAFTIAIVATLETLLNLEAVDRLDPQKRTSPPNRELVAQGIGNITCGLIGGLPLTSVIVRSSVRIHANGQTKLATIIHGFLLAGCVLLIPGLLNKIPLSSLAAILLVTGYKLANPKLLHQMWIRGLDQFLPFVVTLVAIVFTDLLVGITIGLGFSLFFVLRSNVIRPLKQIQERHIGGEVLRIELANQVSFLNRATLYRTLSEIPRGSHVLLDARNTNHIDLDIRQMLAEFENETAPAHGVVVSKVGFKEHYEVKNQIQYVDFVSRELQQLLTPEGVLAILCEGNERFRTGRQLSRDLGRQMGSTAEAQFPLAVLLGCIDSRTPAEVVFDLGLGEIFAVRLAGNIADERVLGSIEYGCAVAGAKLVVIKGHTGCGAVTAAIRLAVDRGTAADTYNCPNVDVLVADIRPAIPPNETVPNPRTQPQEFAEFVDRVAQLNVLRTMAYVRTASPALAELSRSGRIQIVGCMYDLRTGKVAFFDSGGQPLVQKSSTKISAPVSEAS